MRVWAYGVPKRDAMKMLWVGVRENTLDADRERMQFASRIELRLSK